MSQSLSTHEFCWLTFEEKRTIEVYSTPLDGDTGQVFEVDHTYPMELHDYQNEQWQQQQEEHQQRHHQQQHYFFFQHPFIANV